MPFQLHDNSVRVACEKHWWAHRIECNQFVQAVADELLILIPGSSSRADLMVRLMKDWIDPSGVRFLIPRGHDSALKAIQFAGSGLFVIAGMTAEDINLAHQWHPPMIRENHGHVALVTPGIGTNGWPRGYWGKDGGVGEKNTSLSRSFPHAHPELMYYFCTKLPQGE